MAVPGVELVVGAVLERAIPPAIDTIKRLYSSMGWSKDRHRVQVVQTEVGAAIERVAALAKVIPGDHLQPYVDQSLNDFRDRLLAEQIPAADVDQIAGALARQIQTTVVEPLQSLNLVRDRLDRLEADSTTAITRLDAVESRIGGLEQSSSRFSQTLWFVLGAVTVLALTAIVLALMRL